MIDDKVLLVEQFQNEQRIIGFSTLNDHILASQQKYYYASLAVIPIVEESLKKGKIICLKNDFSGKEIHPADIIIQDGSDFENLKNKALYNITELINQNILAMCIIDAMDYLNYYMKLMSAGIFITDSNREDKYFEIIEAAQENEKPEQLKEDHSFEDEQNYIEKKKLYDISQENLTTLEKYLNAYDKLAKINFVNTLLNDIKQQILDVKSEAEIQEIVESNRDKIKTYFYSKEYSNNDNIFLKENDIQ